MKNLCIWPVGLLTCLFSVSCCRSLLSDICTYISSGYLIVSVWPQLGRWASTSSVGHPRTGARTPLPTALAAFVSARTLTLNETESVVSVLVSVSTVCTLSARVISNYGLIFVYTNCCLLGW